MDQDHDLHEEATADLLKDLTYHVKRLVEAEMTRLKHELQGARHELDGAVAEGRGMMAETRTRFTRALEAVKTDVREKTTRATAAAKPITIGGVLAHTGALALVAALILGLGQFMALWLAALIVGVVIAGTGALILSEGVSAAKLIGRDSLVRTKREISEDRQWMKSIRESIAARISKTRSALSGVELPRLRPSSNGAPDPTT